MKKEYTAANTFRALKHVPLDLNGIDFKSFEMEDVCSRDYPDFADAFISYAEYHNGKPLTDDEIEQLNDEHSDIVYEAALDSIF